MMFFFVNFLKIRLILVVLVQPFWALSGRVQRNVNQDVHVIRFVYQAALQALDHARPS